MKKYLKILKKSPLFCGIEDEDIIKMLGCLNARVVSFDKKYTIFPEGSRPKYVGIVLSGSVHVIQMDYYGNQSIISDAYPSQIFAEEFACAEIDSLPVSAVANEPCEVMLLDCTRMLYTCNHNCSFHRQMIFNFMKELATKSVMLNQKIQVISKRTTREKLMSYLMIQASKVNSDSFDIPFDRQELADYLEIDRSGLSAEIGKLKREGVIENRKNHFRLL